GRMVYDAARATIVWWGGYVMPASGSPGPGQTWEYGTHWVQRTGVTNPMSRAGFSMAYDSWRQRVVVFGGGGSSGRDGSWVLNDVREWDGTTWSAGQGGPDPRSSAGLAYDSQRASMVLFGGAGITVGGFGDTWEYGPAFVASCVPFGSGC